ncbi:MAG: hypothetical protein ABL877_07380 [Thiobacillus sp.]
MDSIFFNSVIIWILIASFISCVWWTDRGTRASQPEKIQHDSLDSHHVLIGK